MDTISKPRTEKGIPFVETRGRPTSQEYLNLLLMPVEESFVSSKSRDTLYQIARNLRIEVRITSAGEQGWRVWKRSKRKSPAEWERHLAEKRAKPLIFRKKREYSARHGRGKRISGEPIAKMDRS